MESNKACTTADLNFDTASTFELHASAVIAIGTSSFGCHYQHQRARIAEIVAAFTSTYSETIEITEIVRITKIVVTDLVERMDFDSDLGCY